MSARFPVAAAPAVPARTGLRIRELTAQDEAAWDRFVMDHELATPFHLLAWKRTIEESFGYRPVYLLAATEDGVLRGVLPLFLVKNPVIGSALISSPFAVYGGILAEDTAALRGLYSRAVEIGHELQVQYIEFRNTDPGQCVNGPNVDRYVSFSQPIVEGDEAILASIPKKTRNLVRKALKPPFEMRYRVTDLKTFEDLYAANMRRLGTPCFPSKYFASLQRHFGEIVDVREVWLEGQPMAASLNFLFRGDMHIYYAAADTRHNALGPNTFMYFDHLRWAGQNGLRSFDFGRCKPNTGVFEFKRHWNTTMRELPYEMVLIRRKELPNYGPTNPKFHLAIRLWQLMPLWLTRLIGPRLIRLFP
jgi:FemAB-related protein (PEP-CTERM system-associated)